MICFLFSLLMTVLTRFEREGGGHLLIATLCLIEVSSFGLLESELLTMLADEENLLPPEEGKENSKFNTAGLNLTHLKYGLNTKLGNLFYPLGTIENPKLKVF